MEGELVSLKSDFPIYDSPTSWTDERLDGPLNLAASGISSINMALEINGVVYTGMGTAGCLYWHEVRGIYTGMGILVFFYWHEFRDIQTCMGNMRFRGLLHWHGLKGVSIWHGVQGVTSLAWVPWDVCLVMGLGISVNIYCLPF